MSERLEDEMLVIYSRVLYKFTYLYLYLLPSTQALCCVLHNALRYATIAKTRHTASFEICLNYLLTINKMNKAYAVLSIHCGSKKNAPTLADYNCDPVQSILIILASCLLTIIKVVRC